MKKKIVTMLIILSMAALILPLLGCNTDSGKVQAQENQVATVQRGNLEIDITASGNLAYTDKEDLAFEIGGTVGGTQLTVDKVLVEEGDMVKKGQVLATLDNSAWQDYLDTLQNSLTNAQRNQTAKERTLTTKQRAVDARQNDLDAAQRLITDKQLALSQAQLNLQTAQYNLNQITDVKNAQNAVDSAQAHLDLALTLLQNAQNNGDPNQDGDMLRKGVNNAQLELTEAKNNLNSILTSSNVKLTYDVATEIQTRVLAVNTAQRAVDNAQVAIDTAETAVATAQNALDDAKLDVNDAVTAVDDAKNSVADAQKTLDDASAKSTQVVAPFDGFITAVNATGGEEVNKGFVACVIADPNKFESTVLVSEMDISKVKLDSAATVSVDSLGGLSFPARVTHISPTATVSSGVVNFKVKVELESTTSAQSSQQSNSTKTATTATGSQDTQLREGLTVTVNIVVNRATNVLLVPNKALSTEGGQAYVQVRAADGTVQKRAVNKGISNYQYTEITQGLSEGEQVVVTKTTTATSTTKTTSTQQSPGGIMIPGISGGGGPPPGGP